MDEARLRSVRNIKVMAAIADNAGGPDERTRLWRGALTVAHTLVERNNGTTTTDPFPIEIYDGADVWLIPESSVRWVRFHDPDSAQRHGSIGFRIEGDAQP